MPPRTRKSRGSDSADAGDVDEDKQPSTPAMQRRARSNTRSPSKRAKGSASRSRSTASKVGVRAAAGKSTPEVVPAKHEDLAAKPNKATARKSTSKVRKRTVRSDSTLPAPKAERSRQPSTSSSSRSPSVRRAKSASSARRVAKPKEQPRILGILPPNDAANIILLSLLYLLQGVPVGLAFGTLPFLLKQHFSFSDMAIFSFAGYPYSLKLLWSPIVDSVFYKSLGRRKSWIIPIQILTGILFYILSGSIDERIASTESSIYLWTGIWFIVIFLCATQDIAVDGWALTLLSKENKQFASTCQTVGLNTGYFLSFTVFLAFNSAEFSNKYFRSVPSDVGLVQLGPYLKFWAILYFAVTAWVTFFKTEDPDEDEEHGDVTISSAYTTIYSIVKLPHMMRFIVVLLFAKIAFVCNEAVSALKLLEKGIHKEDLALAVLIDFPFQILFGYLAAQWSQGERPLRPWLYGFYGRLCFAVVGMVVVYLFPEKGVTTGYFTLVIVTSVLNSFMSTVQFVGLGAFFSHVADPIIGGTYMTLLNTFSNFGGTWPRFFVLEAVDIFSSAVCSADGSICVKEPAKLACVKAGGACLLERDGYYWVGGASVIIGVMLLCSLIRPSIRTLEALPVSAWRVSKRRQRAH